MRITVMGLWHLGCVTSGCLAKHHDVVGLDFDKRIVDGLLIGKLPIFEPGLNELINNGLVSKKLEFTTDSSLACKTSDVLWVTIDTPVDDRDESDTESVLTKIRDTIPHLKENSLIILSSQLPVGTCRKLSKEFSNYRFAVIPENLRLGKAIEIFENPDRIIIGAMDSETVCQLVELLSAYKTQIIWMGSESAEMTKHAINSFLAMSITFMNEVARLCELTKANAKDVERGLKSEERIGPKAYLSAGNSFSGGTLARDVKTLNKIAEDHGEKIDVLSSIIPSNINHSKWPIKTLSKFFTNEEFLPEVCVLGLTYKAGTNTLRRSSSIEFIKEMHDRGCCIRAFDPSNPELPSELSYIKLSNDVEEAVSGSHAIVIGTECPEFKKLNWEKIIGLMKTKIIIDAGGFLQVEIYKTLYKYPNINYRRVGSIT